MKAKTRSWESTLCNFSSKRFLFSFILMFVFLTLSVSALSVNVKDSNGNPQANANVEVYQSGDINGAYTVVGSAVTDSSGLATVTDPTLQYVYVKVYKYDYDAYYPTHGTGNYSENLDRNVVELSALPNPLSVTLDVIPAIWTDRTEYLSNDVVHISGSSFDVSSVHLTTTLGSQTVDEQDVAVSNGAFETSFALTNGVDDTYTVTATGSSQVLATTTFRDCPGCTIVTFYPTDDTYVRNQSTNSYVNNNYDDGDLHVKWRDDGNGIDRRRAYVKFDLSSIPSTAVITSSTLHLYQFDADATNNITVANVSNTNTSGVVWTENNLRWRTAPTNFGTGAVTSVDNSDGFKTLTVSTSEVSSVLSGNKNLSLAVKFSTESTSKHHDFCDREGTGSNCDNPQRPYLEVCYENQSVCGNGVLESGEQCEKNVAGGWDPCCDNSTCQYKTAGAECRAAAGVCDVAEVCSGSSATCPSDSKRPNTYECRASADVCDVAEKCDGINNNCPTDVFKPSTTVCRAASGQCDVAENCTGSGPACPADGKAQQGTLCDDTQGCTFRDACDGNGNCAGTNVDCAGNNILPITSCTNDPDNISFTWDYRCGFTSQCVPDGPNSFHCTTGSDVTTHTCNTTCGAQCLSTADCTNHCTELIRSFNSNCNTTDCTCSYQTENCGALNGMHDDFCWYGASCNPDQCNHNEQYCPTPGTINNSICYWGTRDCTANGCTLSDREMTCYDTCNATNGPIDTSGPVVPLDSIVVNPNPAGPMCYNNATLNATAVETCAHIHDAEFYVYLVNNPHPTCQVGGGEVRYGKMSAVDGTYDDQQIENTTGTFYVGGLTDGGGYQICVKAQNDNGTWGGCNCSRLEIDNVHPLLTDSGIQNYHWNDAKGYWVCADNFTYKAYFCDQADQSCIAGAEYFVKPPNTFNEVGGTGIPMLPSDGHFSEPETTCDWANATVTNTQYTEGAHAIKSEAIDCACNWGKLLYQTPLYIVIDRTPPVSSKTVGEPKAQCDYLGDQHEAESCYFIKTSTPINLSAHDVDNSWDGNYSNAVQMKYRYRWKYDYNDTFGEWSDWVNYTTPFIFTNDSIHELEYYSVDRCGNQETHHFEIDIVDSKPPVTNKSMGAPSKQVDCNTLGQGTYTDGCYYATSLTPIGLDCFDQKPHPIDDVKIYYKIDWKNDSADIWQEGTWATLQGTLYFVNDSYHRLSWYCMDALNNTESTHTELDIVDNNGPVSSKTLGDPKHACETQEECDYYITQNTPITLTCADQLPHPIDNVTIYWRYRLLQGDSWTEFYSFNNNSPQVTFTFPEDSHHELQYWCVDELGNQEQGPYEGVNREIDLVDTQAPVTNKTVVGPQVACDRDDPTGCDYYLNQSSEVHLDCTDQLPHPVGHVDLYYKIDWKNESGDEWQEGTWNDTGMGNVIISYTEDSFHRLTYYCVDTLGNTEQNHTEIDIVDSLPPVSNKTVGTPKKEVDCSSLEQGEYTDGCYYITPRTPVDITCYDPQPHPVQSVAIFYKVDWKNESGDEWQDGAWNYQPTGQISVSFLLNNDSYHRLSWYCVDALNNTESTHTELDIVDNQPPMGIKTIGEPKLRCSRDQIDGITHLIDGQQEPDCWWVQDTEPCTVNSSGNGSSRTYTLDSDFDEGILNGLEYTTVHNQLQISSEVTTYPTMWIANAGEDSLSKWDTNANKEVGRYHTWFGPLANHGAWDGPAPSRTAVDADGNVYVANRHFDGKPADVIKIYLTDYVDRNSNGVMDTSNDTNSDGTIQESEMAPAMVDSNSNGRIDPNEITDERVAWVTSVGPNGCLGRALAIDGDGNIWLGCFNTRQFYKLDGQTGAILAGPISVPTTPYGALVDKHGILWSGDEGYYLLRLDTNTYATQTFYNGNYGASYGIALGYDSEGYTHIYLATYSGSTYIEFNSKTSTFSTPASSHFTTLGVATDKEGNIVVGAYGSGTVAKFAPNGTLIWSATPQVNAEVRGVVVDSNDDVWAVHLYGNKLAKYRGSDGAPLGTFNTGRSPYTYTDAAGLGLRTSVSAGTWNVVYDSGASNNTLGPVSWNSNVPENTQLTVKVRSSTDGTSWSPYETVSNGVPFATTPNGRYLEVQVSMKSEGETSPVLYDLTVASGGAGSCVPQGSKGTPITLDCQDPQPHPVDNETMCYRIAFDSQERPWLTSDYCTMYGGTTNDGWCCVNKAQLPYTFKFTEDSNHTLEFYCRDELNNTGETQIELDRVDSVPPTTVKTYGTPFYSNGAAHWITSQTPIYLNTTDGGAVCAVGVNQTYYRWILVDDRYCQNDALCQQYDGVIDKAWDSASPQLFVNIREDSCHLIEYYSVDMLGNAEPVKKQCVFVDNKPPLINKTLGDPKHACETQEECDYYITQNTPITLTCVDQLPHPVNNVTIYYRYQINGTGEWHEFSHNGQEVTFNYPTDSRHHLEYWCVDELGNTAEKQYEDDIVDTQPPVTTKLIGNPKIQGDGFTWVTSHTPITLECNDQQPHPVDHSMIWYRYRLDGGSWTDWADTTIHEDNKTIYFPEDSVHELQYYCVDALNNTEQIHNETDKVDNTPPVTTKIITGCHTPCNPGEGCDYWVGKDTVIGFSAVDGGAICAVGVNYTKYSVSGEYNHGWSYYDPAHNITFGSGHYDDSGYYHFQYYSVDMLGNNETKHNETDIYENKPPFGWILNPSSGRYYHDGETFEVMALAGDSGSPASGVASCEFSAIDIHFEDLNSTQLYQLRQWMNNNEDHDLNNLLHILAGSYTLVDLGSVPYMNNSCQGTLTIPNPSNITNKAYLVIKIIDRSCNQYYDLARNFVDGDIILMDFDNTAPHVTITDHDGLSGIVEDNHPFVVYADISENRSGSEDCWADLYRGSPCIVDEIMRNEGGYECQSSPMELIPGAHYAGTMLSDHQCRVSGTIPDQLQDGLYTLVVSANDEQFNIGNDSVSFLVDGTPPVKELYEPTPGGIYGPHSGIPVKIGMNDTTAGVDPSTVQYRIYAPSADLDHPCITQCPYDSGWRSTTLSEGDAWVGNYTSLFNISAENLTSGTYYIRLRGCDVLYSAPLPSGSQIPPHCVDPLMSIIIDIEPPQGPYNVTIDGNTLTWAAAHDNFGVDYYEIYFDGVFNDTVNSTGATNYTYTTTNTSVVNISIVAFDFAGNNGSEVFAQPPTPIPPAGPVCGNGVCESGETTITCPQDCHLGGGGGGGGYSGGGTISTGGSSSSGSSGGSTGGSTGGSSGGATFTQCSAIGQACAVTSDCCGGHCVDYKCSMQETTGPATRVDILAPTNAMLDDVVVLKMVDENNNSVAGATILIISPTKESLVLITDSTGQAGFKATDAGTYYYEAPGHYIMAIRSTYVVKPDKTPTSLAETPTQEQGLQAPTSVGMSLAAYAPWAIGLLALLLIAFFLATRSKKKNGNNKK